MKKVINGKTYNTKTTTEIASASSGGSTSDFSYWSETLHKSPKGQYFIEGEGGPMSRYARSYGQNSLGWGDEIRLLTAQEALQWLQENEIEIDEEIEKEFTGIIEEG